MATGFYTNTIFLEHDTGNHPENADRLRAIDQHLRYSGLLNKLEVRPGRAAEPKEIEILHSRDISIQLWRLSNWVEKHLEPQIV